MNKFIKSQVKSNLDEQRSYSSHSYRCSKCRDLTFILNDNEAIPCECREILISEQILKNSGISEGYRNKTFKNFNYAYDMQILDAFNSARSYVKDFKGIKNSRNNSIIFMGQVGSGKTHLCLAIANNFMKYGVGVVYMSYRDSIIQIKQNIMDGEAYNRIIHKYKNASVLLIDDLFKGSISTSDINIMFEIINHRYFNNKPIIVSSEKYVQDLLNIDESVGSRILEMCKGRVVELKGKMLNHRIYG
ncbi:DNA replication protein [Romboutsia weinsteinii]|uniref:DNA replication protein n=2 Tax=Romboutsia weinsteinii TaxID=2020949 RepID=A0A371J418_9FIRM|nr:DNA replication protein [Romboutsia weinsteinii]